MLSGGATNVPSYARYPVRVTFFSASGLPMVRPFTTEIYLSITSPAAAGREIARSRKVKQYRSTWNETVGVILTPREIQVGLMVTLVQVLPDRSLEGNTAASPAGTGGVVPGVTGSLGGGEFVVGSAQFGVETGVGGSNGGVVVNVAGGTVLLKVELGIYEAVQIVQERVLYLNDRCLDDMMDIMVLKVCYFVT
jgi:hypothetical protein